MPIPIIDRLLRVGEGRILKRLEVIAKQVNAIEEDFEKLTDAELRENSVKVVWLAINSLSRLITSSDLSSIRGSLAGIDHLAPRCSMEITASPVSLRRASNSKFSPSRVTAGACASEPSSARSTSPR